MVTLQTSRFQLLYNPFIYIAGWTSVLLAIIVLLTVSALCYLSGTHHYGLLNINFAKDTAFTQFFLEHFIHWSTSTVLLYAAGVLLSVSSIRFIDVAGTLGLARFPLIILSLVRFLPPFESFVINSPNMYFLFVLHLCLASWSVVLMFNAYRTACNLKQTKLVASFFICLSLSEIITQSIIRFTL